jgi:hypothetical protein
MARDLARAARNSKPPPPGVVPCFEPTALLLAAARIVGASAPRAALAASFARRHRRSAMRSARRARWASFALVTATCLPALAGDAAPRGTPAPHVHARKSLADCATFDQVEKDDVSLELTIHNTCTIPIDCSISWRVVCAPASHKRRSVHASSTKLALVEGAAQSTTASAAVCGDDAWSMDHIEWSCNPNPE